MGGVLRVLLGKDPTEPLLGRASITAFVMLAIAFGAKLTTDQASALIDVLVFVLPVAAAAITAVATRSKVTPVKRPRAADGAELVKKEEA